MLFLALLFEDRLGRLGFALGLVGAGGAAALQDVLASIAAAFSIGFCDGHRGRVGLHLSAHRVCFRIASFTVSVSGAPSGATSAGIQTIQVRTSSQTNCNTAAGVGSLTDVASVSLRGLLFAASPSPL